MKVYVWILKKKMYMLTNLWQNILCKAQYLKLQYFWFLKQTRKKHIRRTSKRSPCIASGASSNSSTLPAGLALQTCNELQKLASCKTGSGHAKCVFSWTQKCIEDCRSRRKRRLWRQSSSNIQLATAAIFQWSEICPCVSFCSDSVTNRSSVLRPSVHASSSDISTLCRTESCSIL